MPSKKSKRTPSKASLWKAARDCSEAEIALHARSLAPLLDPGSRVLLEGPMGAGKSTFARALFRALGVTQPAEGSPSFAIAHEYRSVRGEVVHLDFYRLESAREIEEAGIDAYFWERPLIVVTEWISRFPDFEAQVVAGAARAWRVELGFSDRDPAGMRNIRIEVTPLVVR